MQKEFKKSMLAELEENVAVAGSGAPVVGPAIIAAIAVVVYA